MTELDYKMIASVLTAEDCYHARFAMDMHLEDHCDQFSDAGLNGMISAALKQAIIRIGALEQKLRAVGSHDKLLEAHEITN